MSNRQQPPPLIPLYKSILTSLSTLNDGAHAPPSCLRHALSLIDAEVSSRS
eukprot:CAMPEP_0182475972 /NCGR_PEP_ID=MMETSP1319-20130603/28260_1 /TAXON_ID=172717 /ORGANISM="Bolidomonas pacifica, Strain RCC208" /LENGTH=50 /DNA_ID=CAMNT_0024677017 /DNA_START=86 /DNA_END=235 /DNA_ORIENTATION=+